MLTFRALLLHRSESFECGPRSPGCNGGTRLRTVLFFLRSRAQSEGKIMQIRKVNEEGFSPFLAAARKISRARDGS